MSASPGSPPAGAEDWFQVKGPSMTPLLREGDAIRFQRCEGEVLRTGDLVVLAALAGGPAVGYVVHRLLWKSRRGPSWRYRTMGDWNFSGDSADGIMVGRVTEIRRRERRFPWAGGRVRIGSLGFLVFAKLLRSADWVFGNIYRRGFVAVLGVSLRGRGPLRLLARGFLLCLVPVLDGGRDFYWRAVLRLSDGFFEALAPAAAD